MLEFSTTSYERVHHHSIIPKVNSVIMLWLDNHVGKTVVLKEKKNRVNPMVIQGIDAEKFGLSVSSKGPLQFEAYSFSKDHQSMLLNGKDTLEIPLQDDINHLLHVIITENINNKDIQQQQISNKNEEKSSNNSITGNKDSSSLTTKLKFNNKLNHTVKIFDISGSIKPIELAAMGEFEHVITIKQGWPLELKAENDDKKEKIILNGQLKYKIIIRTKDKDGQKIDITSAGNIQNQANGIDQSSQTTENEQSSQTQGSTQTTETIGPPQTTDSSDTFPVTTAKLVSSDNEQNTILLDVNNTLNKPILVVETINNLQPIVIPPKTACKVGFLINRTKFLILTGIILDENQEGTHGVLLNGHENLGVQIKMNPSEFNRIDVTGDDVDVNDEQISKPVDTNEFKNSSKKIETLSEEIEKQTSTKLKPVVNESDQPNKDNTESPGKICTKAPSKNDTGIKSCNKTKPETEESQGNINSTDIETVPVEQKPSTIGGSETEVIAPSMKTNNQDNSQIIYNQDIDTNKNINNVNTTNQQRKTNETEMEYLERRLGLTDLGKENDSKHENINTLNQPLEETNKTTKLLTNNGDNNILTESEAKDVDTDVTTETVNEILTSTKNIDKAKEKDESKETNNNKINENTTMEETENITNAQNPNNNTNEGEIS